MEALIKYFESLEARIIALEEAQQTNEALIASLQAEVEALKNRPAAEPQVVEKIVEKPVEVIKEVIVEKPGASPQSNGESGLRLEGQTEEPVAETPKEEEPQPVQEEVASPKAAIYGMPVDDIRKAISLGDRFLYQRELFGQNAELMQRTLTELDALSSYDEAVAYIAQFNWDTESNTYQQFIVTLHRRFG